MDFINRGFAQLTDLFKSMTPGARLTAGLLLVMIGVSVAFLFKGQLNSSDSYLMAGGPFTATELRDMEAAFGKAGLEGYEVDGARIKVPHGQQSKYMAALADANALPHEFGDYLQRAISGSTMFTPHAQQQAAMKIAKQRELQSIISQMNGVDRAAVHIDEQAGQGFLVNRVVTASVSISPRGNQPLDEARVPGIRYLVAGSVAGLKPEAVTVIDLSTGLPYPGTGGGGDKSSSLMNEYTELKRHHERQFQQKISQLLSHIRGALVTTSVELDPEIVNDEKSTEYDNKSVVYESRENTATKLVEGASPGGRPGVAAQGGVNQPAVVAAPSGPKANDDTSQTEQRKAVPTTLKHIVREGRTPKRVTVSVAIPNTYYEEIWRKQNSSAAPDAKPEAAALADIQGSEKKKIEEAIVPLLPKRDAAADPFPQVAVTMFYPATSEPLPEPTVQDEALAWFGQNWRTVGLGGLALMSLVMLRSMVRSTPMTTSPTGEPAPQTAAASLSLVADDEPAPPTDTSARSRLKRRTVDGPSLRDELADIVREDPESAVSILRTWIGNAS